MEFMEDRTCKFCRKVLSRDSIAFKSYPFCSECSKKRLVHVNNVINEDKIKAIVKKYDKKQLPTSLKMTETAWLKMLCYSELANPYEIHGMCKIENEAITDCIIFKQIVNRKYCLTEWISDAFQYYNQLQDQQLYTLDWHSHVYLPAYESAQDNKYYKHEYAFRGSFPYIIINLEQQITSQNFYGVFSEKLDIDFSNIYQSNIVPYIEQCTLDIQQLVGFTDGRLEEWVEDSKDLKYLVNSL